jgi:hypothetical protein
VASVIWQALEKACDPLIRKMLIFVPSRSYCDELSGYLKEYLRERRDIAVYAHHGSLDKQIREGAEQEFSSSRDAVLVATSTLEVGVDIGDVDAVALVGPPADTNSLLQRIGRSGRRSGITRVLAIARSDVDRFAMSSMLVAARNGLLDPVPYGRRWSVCVQQIGSYIKQAPGKGRRVVDIAELAETVWPGNGAKNAEAIVQALHDDGYVAFANDRLHHGEQWADIWSGMGLHGNFDSGSLGTPVIDSVTGETIAHIPQGSAVENQIAIGGSNWTVIRSRDELLLEPLKRGSSGTAVRYSARKAPTGRSFARHISIGLGFADNEILGIEYQGCSHWFHFGGSAYELLLLSLMTKLERVDGLVGITLRGDLDLLEVAERITPDKVKTQAIKQMKSLSGLFAPGPFHKILPVSLQEETLLELLSPESFCAWLQSRRIRLITPEHQQFSTLSAILASV